MKRSKMFVGLMAACLIALFSFDAEANAQNAKFGNFSPCNLTVWFGVNDGFGNTYAIGPIPIAANAVFYFTLPTGHFVYKIHFNGVSFAPPAPGTCVGTGMLCPVRLCTDSPSSWYVL